LLLASASLMSSFRVDALALGEKSSTTLAADLRVILPLPSLLQVCDSLLTLLVQSSLATALPVRPDSFVGAVRRAQVLDIAHGLATVVEKGLEALPSRKRM
jgi:hypothetical protein